MGKARAMQLLAWTAGAALAVAVMVTVADIAVRAFGRLASLVWAEPLGFGIVGVVDIVQLCVVTAAWLSVPWGFAIAGHVSVDLLESRLPAPARRWLGSFTALATCGFLASVLLASLRQFQDIVAWGDRSATLGIAMFWYWLPLIAGLALSVAITLAHTLRSLSRRLGAGHR
ncbi:hypothetical protein HRbin40_01691 [bacterium HR40]|nr:hypothetical protein HRbin40_01691 [bacterium HR40]